MENNKAKQVVCKPVFWNQSSKHRFLGYYCSNCDGYFGKQAKGQLFCPYCKAKVVDTND